MDDARLEFFLDDGWNLIGRIHHWLSALPESAANHGQINGLIRGLQTMWSAADDLEINRIARTSLAIEQLLERIVAGSLEYSSQVALDLTNGTECLQELLLGLEATREEPEFSDQGALLRMERRTTAAARDDREEIVPEGRIEPAEVVDLSQDLITCHEDDVVDKIPIEEADCKPQSVTTDKVLLGMLEQFVAKLDDTCQQLHSRMMSDETHYVTTTSRLEHLSHVTRELVDQIIHQSTIASRSFDDTLAEIRDLSFAMTARSIEADASVVSDVESLEPSPYSVELNRIAREIEELLPSSLIKDGMTSVPIQSMANADGLRNKILIVEPSLFYRHLMSATVQSTGFEPTVCESMSRSVEILETMPEIAAILISPTEAVSAAETICQLRSRGSIKLIEMKGSNEDCADTISFDASVSRTHPLELIEAIERLLCMSDAPVRRSA